MGLRSKNAHVYPPITRSRTHYHVPIWFTFPFRSDEGCCIQPSPRPAPLICPSPTLPYLTFYRRVVSSFIQRYVLHPNPPFLAPSTPLPSSFLPPPGPLDPRLFLPAWYGLSLETQQVQSAAKTAAAASTTTTTTATTNAATSTTPTVISTTSTKADVYSAVRMVLGRLRRRAPASFSPVDMVGMSRDFFTIGSPRTP